MKLNFILLPNFIILLLLIANLSHSTTILDTLSDYDKVIFAEYKQHHKNDPAKDLAITQLICDHIKSSSPTVVSNAFVLFNRLTDKHKAYFDDVFIEYMIKEIGTGMTYQEYKDRNSYFIRCLTNFGRTRTEKSITLKFQLMEPIENWPESFQKGVRDNLDKKIWVTKIRKYALDSLLEPKDKKGEELIPIIESKLNSFETNKTGYAEMKSSIEFYKEYYAELKQGIDRFSLGGF